MQGSLRYGNEIWCAQPSVPLVASHIAQGADVPTNTPSSRPKGEQHDTAE